MAWMQISKEEALIIVSALGCVENEACRGDDLSQELELLNRISLILDRVPERLIQSLEEHEKERLKCLL